MARIPLATSAALLLLACGGASPAPQNAGDKQPDANEFQTQRSGTAGSAHGASESKIKATMSHAAMKFFVVDKESKDPVVGVVISLQADGGKKYYTGETDAMGYAEVLVPAGKMYQVVYLSLGEEKINAKVEVSDAPMQNIKLTLRYKRYVPEPVAVVSDSGEEQPSAQVPPTPVFRLDDVNFGSASAKLERDSFPRLDSIVEYMTHKPSSRIEVSGHTDDVGSADKNKVLSEKRALACRAYLVSKGIDESRIEAIGYGDERPVASNNTDDGRRKNRRIEAKELVD